MIKSAWLPICAAAISTLCTTSVQAAEKLAAADCSATLGGKHCRIECVDPQPCCEESKKVIDLLQQLVGAYSVGDLKTYEQYLDDNCSMFYEGTKKIISGKKAVLAHMKESFARHAPGGSQPLEGFSIDQPFAKVTNDTCVVTFIATKKIGGINPHTEQAHITDVFIKRADGWKKLHWSGQWETITASK